jgi:hypothetical protein
MFDFFIKKKEIVLDCFTYVPHAYDYAKIDQAVKYFPDWWKSTPKLLDSGSATIKNCVGLIDYYKKGIVIPSWFALEVNVFEHGNSEWFSWESSNHSVATNESHVPEQFYNFTGDQGKNLKITSPWAFKTKEDIYFTWSQPTWSHRSLLQYITALPAVVNFKYQHSTNLNFFVINKHEVQKFTIPPIEPLIILHPMTEKTVSIKNHLVSKEEWDRIFGLDRFVFNRNSLDTLNFYKKRKKLHQKLDQSKCPFFKG